METNIRKIVVLVNMNQETWNSLNHREREELRDYSKMSPQLIGLEGWRVEVEDIYGEVRRFIVGKSTGWRPIHLEIKNRRSSGGNAADQHYKRVTSLYNADE